MKRIGAPKGREGTTGRFIETQRGVGKEREGMLENEKEKLREILVCSESSHTEKGNLLKGVLEDYAGSRGIFKHEGIEYRNEVVQ